MQTWRSFSSLLYKDSPFLPTASQESLERIAVDINTNRFPAVFAIAKEVALVGVEQNHIHQEEFDWIGPSFQATPENISDYMFGFVTPPSLIVGGYTLKQAGLILALKLFCPPTDDPELIKHNGYKSFHLFYAYHVISSAERRLPLVGATPIYQLCQTEVFKNTFFYLAGLEASRRLFTEIANLLYPF